MSDRLAIVLGAPGAAEMPLLADLGARDDLDILGVIDPTAAALGTAIAEIMGLAVVPSLDLLVIPNGSTPLVVLPDGPATFVADLAAGAQARGLGTVTTTDLRARLTELRARTPSRDRAPLPRPDLSAIARETDTIQATLASLEDALAGDTILRRLLDLATQAASASGGSIMLFDEASAELYIAYATGLSEGTLHGTRVKLGEGIAGRVARTRQAELVTGAQGPSRRRRDRPDITSAVSTPLVHEGQLLGVVNISTQAGEAALGDDARALMDDLAPRLSRILHGVQLLQQERTSRIFDLTEQQLRRLAAGRDDLPAMLVDWCQALAVTADAVRVALVVPCEDGSLLACENTPDGGGGHWYEPLHNPAWLEVLPTGLPLVARQVDLEHADRQPLTVFYLPVGREPVRAGLAVHFRHSRTAHGFHALAGEMVFLLERLLVDQLAQRRQHWRADRLADLSACLLALNEHDGTVGQLGERICAAALQLAGARYGAAVANVDVDPPRLAGGNVPADAAWLPQLARLLRSAAQDGWRITTLETGTETLSVLAAVSNPGTAAPGLVLLGKQRQHVLDGQVFTTLDAELVQPLAASVRRAVPDAIDLTRDILPVVVDIERPAAGCPATAPQLGRDRLLEDLRRELDRCDRYHNVCGLVLLRPALPPERLHDLLQAAGRRLSTHLRISDRLYPLVDEGCLAVLVPEDVQRLDRVQARLQQALRDISGDPDLAVSAARVAYPASSGTAESLLERVCSRLDA